MTDSIGPYKVIRQLGEGGQGMVYLAAAPDGTRVAVKVLREGIRGDGRFAKEIAAARRVEPFCIAQVLDASLGGRPYIVTEYVEGPSLREAGRHTGADLQRLAVATATALVAIHRAGVVHRDFKPANVLLGRDGPRVIDFGIARAMDDAVTRTSSIVGTPAYMAPEQFAGAAVGPAADVFAWASVMVYAATGAPPFGNDSLPAVLRRIQYEEPRLDGVPEPLRSIVHACLAKDPHARPAMQDVLFRLIGGPSPATPFADGSPPVDGPGTGGAAQAGARPGHRSPRALERTGPTHAAARRRAGVVFLAAGTALAVTGALVAAWIWLPVFRVPADTTAIVTTSSAASPTSRPVTGAKESARALRPAGSPRPTKTATAQPSATTPSTSRTTTRPSARPTTAKPTATTTGGGSGGVTSVTFTYEGIRVGDCWRNDMNIWAKVSATGTYTYRWLVNGQNQGRQQGTSSSKPLLPSIVWKGPGTYRVVFEVVTPTSMRKSTAVTICGDWEGWQ
ncbi:serine/threonine protein kinase [Nonomuraea polychroma]|uniref:non-specific serine/threonine protein kinase n=1 Tax=Nonomuraea polychroma TaxID=46176 RepID=A0A438MEW7_9ACTN|nr:serine/threonine-protein kinase [Nonomuraea polychroma]RVX44061.1 serine/threonine protein kinase [Nonomuraea polychroma]